MFPLQFLQQFWIGGANICMVTLLLSDSAKEEGKLSVFKMSDLRGWDSWCARFALMFIHSGMDSHHETSFAYIGYLIKQKDEPSSQS